MSEVRINGIVSESITDGPGIRYTVFTQGCAHNCPGCHNPETHDYNGGSFKSTEEMLEAIRRDPMITGVTLSGGEPFDQADKLLEFAKTVKVMKLELAAYTGYIYEHLLSVGGSREELLRLLDVVIDGPFIMDQRNLDIRFKGSENQRIIDVPASLAKGEVVLKEDGRWIAGEDPFPAIVPERV